MGRLSGWAVVAAATVLSLGCATGGADDNAGDRAGSDAAGAPELAERLGCDRTEPGHRKGWDDGGPVECFSDDGWAATIHAPLDHAGRGSALTLLRSRYVDGRDLVPCRDGSYFTDVSVVYGETWVAVVTSDAGADYVRDRLGGTIFPGDGGTGPPVSYGAMPCPD
jgi:hypothetical protein